MSRSRIRQKHAADAIQLRRISHPASHPYKEVPYVRGNGASMQDAPLDKDKDQRIYHPVEDQAERLPGGVYRPPGLAEPGLVPVQVHFEEWLPRHLITSHMCIGGKPTSRAINRPLLHPPQNTHTHFIPFSPRRLSSLLLS